MESKEKVVVVDDKNQLGSDDDNLLVVDFISEELDDKGEKSAAAADEELCLDKVGSEREEIVKELKRLRRQNIVTHCLLSVMIVLTVTWQLSEVSLILKLKEGMNNPFRSLGNLFTGMLNRDEDQPDKHHSTNKTPKQSSSSSSSSLPGLKIPRLELPDLDFNGNHE